MEREMNEVGFYNRAVNYLRCYCSCAKRRPRSACCVCRSNQAVMAQAANGHLVEAEALLPRATASGNERGRDACTGMVLANMARIMAVIGNIADAERLAQ